MILRCILGITILANVFLVYGQNMQKQVLDSLNYQINIGSYTIKFDESFDEKERYFNLISKTLNLNITLFNCCQCDSATFYIFKPYTKEDSKTNYKIRIIYKKSTNKSTAKKELYTDPICYLCFRRLPIWVYNKECYELISCSVEI